jgi:hypothetical protein
MQDQCDVVIAPELSASDGRFGNAVQPVEHSASHMLRVARISDRMMASLAGLTIDPYLHGFLTVTWVHAIERAGRTDDTRAQRYRLLVPDLLWSIVPKAHAQDRTQLLALLPITLSDLREGMILAGLELPQRQNFMNWLVDAHANAMRAAGAAASALPLSTIHEHFSCFIERRERDVVVPAADRKRAADRLFLDAAIRELEQDLLPLDQIFDRGQRRHDHTAAATVSADGAGISAPDTDTAIDAAEPDFDESVLARLRSGVAIDFNLDGSWSRGRLNWSSRNAPNLVLSVDEHTAPSFISVRMMRRLLRNDRARFIGAVPLFERTVLSLLEDADQMERERA